MLDIGWPELMLVAVITVLVVGPKELPRVLRTVTYWVRKAQGLAREFQTGMNDLARQTDLEEIKKDMKKVAEDTTGPLKVDKFDEMLDPDNSIAGMFTGKAIRSPTADERDKKKEESDEDSGAEVDPDDDDAEPDHDVYAARRAAAAAEEDTDEGTAAEDPEELKRYREKKAAAKAAAESKEKESEAPAEAKPEEAAQSEDGPPTVTTSGPAIELEPLPSVSETPASGPSASEPSSSKQASDKDKSEPETEKRRAEA